MSKLRDKAVNVVVTNGAPDTVSSYYARGGANNRRFETIAFSAPCHASLFGQYGGSIRDSDRRTLFAPDIRWDVLCTNVANNKNFCPETAWRWVNWITSEDSPWRDVFAGGFEIIERDGLPWALLFENGEHLSSLPPALIFNLCIAARAPSEDGRAILPVWADFIDAGLSPAWAFVCAGWFSKSRYVVPLPNYRNYHWCLYRLNCPLDFVAGRYNPCKTQGETNRVWGQASGFSLSDLIPTHVEYSHTKTKFTQVSMLDVPAYVERIKDVIRKATDD